LKSLIEARDGEFVRRYRRYYRPLSNFVAWIIEYDTNGFLIEGQMADGRSLPPVRVRSFWRGWTDICGWSTYGAGVFPGGHADTRQAILFDVCKRGVPFYKKVVESEEKGAPK